METQQKLDQVSKEYEAIKKQLTEYLIKLPSQLLRKLWIEYVSQAESRRNICNLPDLCLILDCILDNTFGELDLCLSMFPQRPTHLIQSSYISYWRSFLSVAHFFLAYYLSVTDGMLALN